jgi:hypothetical protein
VGERGLLLSFFIGGGDETDVGILVGSARGELGGWAERAFLAAAEANSAEGVLPGEILLFEKVRILEGSLRERESRLEVWVKGVVENAAGLRWMLPGIGAEMFLFS